MFNRRRFIAVVGAVLAAPVAAVKGWFERTQDDNRFLRRNPIACESCGADDMNYATFVNYECGMEQLDDGPVQKLYVCLCDPCAEKKGYLCKRRHENGGGNYPCLCGLRGCSGVGPWLNEVDTYKPPTIQDFQTVMDRQQW